MNSQETKTETHGFRSFPDARIVRYVFYDGDGEIIYREDYPPDPETIPMWCDGVACASYYSVEVDGISYKRYPTIHSPKFYNLIDIPDQIAAGSKSMFTQKHMCDFCGANWEMDEEQFLKNGSIWCNACKYRGGIWKG